MSSSQQCHFQSQNPENASAQDCISLAQCNGAFKFLIPVLVAAVQVGVQGTTKSPLETHPGNMYIFLLATIIYCFALRADTTCKFHLTSKSPDDQTHFLQLFGAIAFISGSLSSVSLISIVMPRWFGYMLFISWALVSVFVAYEYANFIKETYRWVLQRMKDTWLYKKICCKVSSLWSNQEILPRWFKPICT